MTDDDPDAKRRWFNRLLDLIPERLRPNRHDQRLLDAAALAYRNGWQPDQLAPLITRIGEQARNPPLLVIVNLENVAAQPPGTPAQHHRIGCPRCVAGWIDRDNQPTAPCPDCRPQLTARLAHIPPPGQRTPADLHHLRHQRTMP